MVSASAWLFASAVRHHRTWTPIALTMIDARTRPEIARRMPIRMSGGTSQCMYREKRHRCKADVFLRYACVSESWPTTRPSGRFDLTFPSGDADGMRLSASKAPDPSIPESFLMRDAVIE